MLQFSSREVDRRGATCIKLSVPSHQAALRCIATAMAESQKQPLLRPAMPGYVHELAASLCSDRYRHSAWNWPQAHLPEIRDPFGYLFIVRTHWEGVS